MSTNVHVCVTRVAAYSIEYSLTSKSIWEGAGMGRLILKFTSHVTGYSNNISSYAGYLLSTITSICEHVVDDVWQQLEEPGGEGVCGRGASILGLYRF